MFLITPLIGKYIGSIGLKFSYTSGMFVNGVCCILSGFLNEMPKGVIFIVMSILIRVVHAFGNAGVITSSFIILTTEFPDDVGKVLGITRILLNIGLFTGPMLGGALYQLDGYRLPFLVIGSAQCLVSMLSFFLHFQKIVDTQSKRPSSTSTCEILRIKGIWISIIGYTISTLTGGFTSVSLEPQVLRKYFLSPLLMGVMFGVKDGFSGFSAPFWGLLCDKFKNEKVLLVTCSLLSMTSLFLLAPPWRAEGNSMGLVVFGLVLNGIGAGGQQVITMADSVHEMIVAGYGDYQCISVVAGLWPSLSGLGRFIARSTSGILVYHLGHTFVTCVVFGLNALLVTATLIFLLVRRFGHQKSDFFYSTFSQNSELKIKELENSLMIST
ncbi:hypothetical protein CHUAL_005716 [Chamberlinius hualienensis]